MLAFAVIEPVFDSGKDIKHQDTDVPEKNHGKQNNDSRYYSEVHPHEWVVCQVEQHHA
ncbi:hypothetical protein [Pontibacter pamirensis]|uniref:hypothetical protein n=1 Tax=Pontibacter pamirensis TaxID=2562824 RepID=UPI001389B5D9|nr:hypothetical protein [Pontibacter pamirensis]